MKRVFSILLKFFTVFILLLILTLSLAIIFGVTIDVSFLKKGIEKSANFTLGREVKINGPIVFKLSHMTAINVQDVHIDNIPNASNPDFLIAENARLEVDLLPLLRGEINFNEIIAENVTLNLENTMNTEANWVFPKFRSEMNMKKRMIRFRGVEKLSLKNITLGYHDASLNKTIHTELDTITGKISSGKNIILAFNGHANQIPFHINLEGLPIEQLMDKTKLWAFKLKGEVGGRKIASKGSFIHSDIPEVKMMFGIKDVDVGLMLSRLGLVKGLSASVGDASLRFAFKGSTLKQVLEESTMYFVVKDGKWKVDLLKGKKSVDIDHLNGEITVEKGNNLNIDLTGTIKDEPLKLKITGTPLVDFVEKPEMLPLVIDAELAKMKLQFKSIFVLPVTSKDANLTFKFSGERLDSLNHLFELNLPAIGPFDVDTQLHVTEKGYDLSKLNIDISDTTLNGKMNLDLTKTKPVLDMTLISDKIQINDFLFKKKDSKKLSNKEKEKIRKILSKEVLSLIQAKIKIEAKEIFSGKDRLGSVSTTVVLQNTHLTFSPLRLNFPGGIVNIDFSFLPKKDNNVIDLKAKINKFDIGIIARRSKPGTDMGGYLYIDTALHSVSPNIKEMMKNAKGHFYFGLVPKNFSADTIDLWAVNLVSAIIDRETEKDQSKVNCFIMRFGMEDGLMKDKIVYMDTSTMIVAGEAEIDFNKETINIVMAPKGKKPQFFSLEVPIKIKGGFKDFGLKVSKAGLMGSVISFITSPVVVPIKRVFVESLPRDGKDACLRAWRYLETNEVKEQNLSTHERNLKFLENQ